jgi:hypothetical protein
VEQTEIKPAQTGFFRDWYDWIVRLEAEREIQCLDKCQYAMRSTLARCRIPAVHLLLVTGGGLGELDEADMVFLPILHRQIQRTQMMRENDPTNAMFKSRVRLSTVYRYHDS